MLCAAAPGVRCAGFVGGRGGWWSRLPFSRRCQEGPTPPRSEEPISTAWGVRLLEGTRDGRERCIHLGAQRRDDGHNYCGDQRYHHAILHRRRPRVVVQMLQDSVVHLRHHWYLLDL